MKDIADITNSNAHYQNQPTIIIIVTHYENRMHVNSPK